MSQTKTCTKCGDEFDGPGQFCDKCASAFFRAYNLPADNKDDGQLTGREVVEMECTHETLCANLSIEDLTKHINDCRRKMQSFQVKLNVAHRVKAKKEIDSANTFTPEEREAFERKAKEMGGKIKDSGRVAKAVKTKKAVDARENAIKAMMLVPGITRESAEAMFAATQPQPAPQPPKPVVTAPQPVQTTNSSKGDDAVRRMMAVGMSEEMARKMLGLQ